MVFYAVGHYLYCRLIEAAADDATLEIEFKDNGCAGLTDDATGTPGVTGVAEVELASVTNISGPGLGVDTEDVTTHDQATAFEEVVATIIRSGEVTVDIVYDPAAATHDAGTGLLYRLEDKIYSFFKLIFSQDTEWEFSGYVIGFEPKYYIENNAFEGDIYIDTDDLAIVAIEFRLTPDGLRHTGKNLIVQRTFRTRVKAIS